MGASPGTADERCFIAATVDFVPLHAHYTEIVSNGPNRDAVFALAGPAGFAAGRERRIGPAMMGLGQARRATRTRYWAAAIVGVGTLAAMYCRDAHSGLKAGGHGTTGAGRAMTTGPVSRHGPFKIIVLSTTLEFHHDAVATGLQMLKELGKATAPERAGIPEWLRRHLDRRRNRQRSIETKLLRRGLVGEPRELQAFTFEQSHRAGLHEGPEFDEKKRAFVDYWAKGG